MLNSEEGSDRQKFFLGGGGWGRKLKLFFMLYMSFNSTLKF
jgi:hypothetical protein